MLCVMRMAGVWWNKIDTPSVVVVVMKGIISGGWHEMAKLLHCSIINLVKGDMGHGAKLAGRGCGPVRVWGVGFRGGGAWHLIGGWTCKLCNKLMLLRILEQCVV